MISWNTDIPEKITNASADVFPLIERIVSSLLPLSSPPPFSLSLFFFLGGGGGNAPAWIRALTFIYEIDLFYL